MHNSAHVGTTGVEICFLLVTPGRKYNMSPPQEDEGSEDTVEGRNEQWKETRCSQCLLRVWIKPFLKLGLPMDFSVLQM